MGYSLNTTEVKIEDEGYLIIVINKITGERAIAKNYCGCVNRKMSFVLDYPNRPKSLCNIVAGRPNALSECLRQIGLPTYQTLKKHATLNQ